MRQSTPNKRLRSRSRKSVSPLSRVYDSNGPDVKVRGSAQQVAEKYVQLSRDAQSAGDRVMAENYLQHAEHYYRILAAAQPNGGAREDRDDWREDRDDAYAADDQPREIRDDGARDRDDRHRNGAPVAAAGELNGAAARHDPSEEGAGGGRRNGTNGHAHDFATPASGEEPSDGGDRVEERDGAEGTQTAAGADGGADGAGEETDEGSGRRTARRGRTRAAGAGSRTRTTRTSRTGRSRRSSVSGSGDADSPKTDA